MDGRRRRRGGLTSLGGLTDRVLRLPLLDDSFPLPVDRPFTLRQAVDAGVTRHRLRTLEQEALVRRVLKGVYVAAQVPDSLPLRTRALRLVVPARRGGDGLDGVLVLHRGAPRGQHVDVPPLSVFRPAGHDRLRNTLCRSGERAFVDRRPTHVGGLRSRRRSARRGTWAGWPTGTGPSARWTRCCGTAASRGPSSSPGSSASGACAAWSSCERSPRSPTPGRSRRASRRCGCGG